MNRMEFDEGDTALLRVQIARANREQALIEFRSMEGPYTLRVPVSQLVGPINPEARQAIVRELEQGWLAGAETSQAFLRALVGA